VHLLLSRNTSTDITLFDVSYCIPWTLMRRSRYLLAISDSIPYYLAKINNGPVIGIINESNTFATYSGTRNAFRMFHFPTNEEEDTPFFDCRLSEAGERYETEDASNLNGLLPMRLVNSQSNPIFEILRDGIGQYCKNPKSQDSFPVTACKFENWKYLKCKENIIL
jgi:hypothetical protein